MSNHLQIHFLRLYELLQGRLEVLDGVSPDLQHWSKFLVFGGLKGEKEMSQLVENDPLVMEAVAELQRFSSDPQMQELERRRKLWMLDYYSGLEDAKEEGLAIGEAKGKAKGIAIGEVKGEAKGKAEDVLRVLTRQQGTIPESLAQRVKAITDIGKLDQLFDLAFDCATLEEFAEHLT